MLLWSHGTYYHDGSMTLRARAYCIQLYAVTLVHSCVGFFGRRPELVFTLKCAYVSHLRVAHVLCVACREIRYKFQVN